MVIPSAVDICNAVVQHGQFDFRLEVHVTRAKTSRGDGLGVQIAERLSHLAPDTDATA